VADIGCDASQRAPDPAQALLTLVQWLSPAFPVGGFAYSHGLEWAVAAGELRDAAAVRRWLTDVLTHGAGRTDAILLAHALRQDADYAALADLARALAPSAERQRETDEQGAAFARTTSALTGRAIAPAPLPVALGQAAGPLGLAVAQVVALAMQAFAATVTAAATRFVPLGQTDAQAILSALHPLILRLAEEAAIAPLSAIGSASLRADLASMQHETLDVRIFRT
jgi:urease accessory protein